MKFMNSINIALMRRFSPFSARGFILNSNLRRLMASGTEQDPYKFSHFIHYGRSNYNQSSAIWIRLDSISMCRLNQIE